MSFVWLPDCLTTFNVESKLYELSRSVQHTFNLISQLEKKVDDLTNTNYLLKNRLYELRYSHQTRQITTYDDLFLEKIFRKCSYTHRLRLKEPFKQPLYKDRNFNLSVYLVDESGNVINEVSGMPLNLSLYTAEENPKLITETFEGYPIVKGNSSTDIIDGIAIFNKICIRSVSSKFFKGVVILVVSTQSPSLEPSSVSHQSIRPLLIRDLIVRAKKI